MKFKAKEDFKHGTVQFEAGNSYSSEKYDLADDEVLMFHGCGWVSVDGVDDIQRNPNRAVLAPANMKAKLEVQGG